MKIIFFGDSITDGSRNRQEPDDLGSGYVKIAAGKLRLLFPDTPFEILNRGIGGDGTGELLLRAEADLARENPDVVVLQVGINDVWRRFTEGKTVTTEEFGRNYRAIVSEILKTQAKLLLLEPFALPVGDKRRLRPQLQEFNAEIRAIAAENGLILIPLDEIFTGVTQDIGPAQFAADSIHPTHRGCRYIADLVIKELKKYVA